MNAEQKRAWFVLVLDAIVCIGFVALGLAINFRVAWAALGLFAPAGFIPLIGRGEKPDERDVAINKHATLAGGMASYTAFVLACMGTWFAVFVWQEEGAVSVHVLSQITLVGVIVLFTVRSIVILVLYGRQVETDRA